MVKRKRPTKKLGERLNERPVTNSIIVSGEISRRILSFFMNNQESFTTKQISRRLDLKYESVRSALRRLCGHALIAKLGTRYILFDGRREAVRNVLNYFGKRVSIETGEPLDVLEKRSLSHGRPGSLPWSNERTSTIEESRVEVVLRSWHDVVAWDSGWPEQKRVTKIHLDPFIIYQIRNAVGGISTDPAGWLWYSGNQFKLAVSKHKAIQLFLGDHTWKDELKEFLTAVPNLEDVHLDRIWSKVAERCEHMNIVREFHVVDPGISQLKPHLFREDRSQRWRSSNNIGAELLSQRSDSSNRDRWNGQERRRRVYKSCHPVRVCSTLRASISEEARECYGTDAARIRTEHHPDPEGSRPEGGSYQERIREETGTGQEGILGVIVPAAIAGGIC